MAQPAKAGFEPVSLSANDIHLSFGPNKVLRGVNLDVPAGTTTAVIGPSGSGKSTLLRTLNRLYEPDRGDILLDGRSVLADNPDRLRQRIGMVFQNFNLFPHRSVLDNVTLAPRKLKRLSAEAARELGRRFVLVDENPQAVDVMRARLAGGGSTTSPRRADRACTRTSSSSETAPGSASTSSTCASSRQPLASSRTDSQRWCVVMSTRTSQSPRM